MTSRTIKTHQTKSGINQYTVIGHDGEPIGRAYNTRQEAEQAAEWSAKDATAKPSYRVVVSARHDGQLLVPHATAEMVRKDRYRVSLDWREPTGRPTGPAATYEGDRAACEAWLRTQGVSGPSIERAARA